jgi:hypothetical protein
VVETTAIPRKNPASSSRTIDGQAVIALSDQAQIMILNEVGTRVWNLIDGRRTFEAIVALVTGQIVDSNEYDDVPSDLSADIEEFLEDIATKGMITMDGVEGAR